MWWGAEGSEGSSTEKKSSNDRGGVKNQEVSKEKGKAPKI